MSAAQRPTGPTTGSFTGSSKEPGTGSSTEPGTGSSTGPGTGSSTGPGTGHGAASHSVAEGGGPSEPELGFDARLARLEALVVELEGGGLGLEAAIERYRDGVALLRGCRATLASLHKQVEELGAEAGSESRPYAGDPDVAEGRGGAPR